MNNHELNNETNQVHNNSSQFMKQSLVNFHELAMNRIKTNMAWWTIITNYYTAILF